MHVVVLGAGYVGLVAGVSVARMGPHRVTMVEKNPARLDELRRGIMPIAEPGLSEAYREAGQRIGVAATIDEVEPPDFVFVAVATPISEAGDPDMMQLRSATTDLRAWPDAHVSIRSTLPPGMSMRLPVLLGRLDGSRLSTNPEFLRQGSAMQDFARPSRIVIGRYPETSAEHTSRHRAAGSISSGGSSRSYPGQARVWACSGWLKADTDDLRGSPALYVARRLLDAGHVVSAFDPAVRRERAELGGSRDLHDPHSGGGLRWRRSHRRGDGMAGVRAG